MAKGNQSRRQKEIIDLLLKEGSITQDALDKAKEEAKRTGLKLESVLEKMGLINDEDIAKVIANALELPYVDLSEYAIDVELIRLIPEDTAKKYQAVPLFKVGKSLTVGMVDPQDIVALDQMTKTSQMEMIEPVVVSEKGLQKIFDSYYSEKGLVEDLARTIEDEDGLEKEEDVEFEKIGEEAPVVKLVNITISKAVKERASDIHIEPEENGLRIRFRVDGVLHEDTFLPKKLQAAIISRVKVLSKMDIAENRKPQDGRIQMKVEKRDLDIRVSTFPTTNGENVVMRILDKSTVLLGLNDVGFQEKDLKAFEKLIQLPNGIVLVTGPTGSGKSSTLYSALSSINSMDKNILTIEDPVEYELPLIRQTQVNPKAGITFANGLRGILRQDPDIIMIGEIRDKETADMAVQASLTGHLVLATLHTNDAASSLTRLADMGIEPFLISSSVAGILAQRLVRMICEKCKEAYSPNKDVLKDLRIKEGTLFYRGKGCKNCQQTGFLGRTAILELLVVNSEIREMIERKSLTDEIKKKAIATGMRLLYQDGLIKVQEGITTLEEVLRVTTIEMD